MLQHQHRCLCPQQHDRFASAVPRYLRHRTRSSPAWNRSVAPSHEQAIGQAAQHDRLVNTNAIIDDILRRVEGSDGGMNLSNEQRDQIDACIDELEKAGKGSRPLKDARLFGNYVVAYTSTRRAPSEGGSPSGGRFRGAIGRKLFQTTGLFQSVLPGEPAPIATNKVAFKLFGLLPGYVGLRGTVEPVGDADDTCNVFFEPPVLSIADNLNLRIGPTSKVQLTTTYLDDRIRIGKGSRGSLFVFTKGGVADEAGMDMVGQQQTSVAGMAALVLFFASLLLGGAVLWASANPLLRGGAVLAWLLMAGVGAVLNKGGVIPDRKAGSSSPAAAPTSVAAA